MQNAKLFRRGIVLPLNLQAEEILRLNDIDEGILVEFVPITNTLFDSLWDLGFFQDVNARVGCLIDDYEEEFVLSSDLESISDAVLSTRTRHPKRTREVEDFLERVSWLAKKGIALKLPLLFVL